MLSLRGQAIPIQVLREAAEGKLEIALSEEARIAMGRSRQTVQSVLDEGRVVYGINTGFGKLSDMTVPLGQVRELQANLVRSHACGFGEPLTSDEARAVMILRANVLAKGLSGARPEVVDVLVRLLQESVIPSIPSRGSVGASGDLAPLAHLALVVMGEGKARLSDSHWRPAGQVLAEAGIQPIELEAKEGLALLNGTQAIGAVGGLALARALDLLEWSTAIGATTLEAVMGTPVAFDDRIHAARPHSGQRRVAQRLRELLESSEIRESHATGDARVQDAYSLRCMPQVHGPALECLEQAAEVFAIEAGSATDNPLVFPDEGDVLSGGNFHGAPLALALDQASIALTMVMSIVERRIDRLVNSDLSDGLPPFLAKNPGLESGFMIAHVAAVAALNEARVLAHPACIDNCTTSAGKEDHVSMGMTSAIKFKQIVELFARMLAIELVIAGEGLEFRKPLKPGRGVAWAYAWLRERVEPSSGDRIWSEDLDRVCVDLLRDRFFAG